MAADPGLHRSGFSEPRKTGAADRSPEASLVKLGRTEEPAAAVHGEDSPGKCGSVAEARKEEPCRCGGEAREGFLDGGARASW